MKAVHIKKTHLSAVAAAGVLTLPGLAVLANEEDFQIPENADELTCPAAEEVLEEYIPTETAAPESTLAVETKEEEQTYVVNTNAGNDNMADPMENEAPEQNSAETIQGNENGGVNSEIIPVQDEDTEQTDTEYLETPVQNTPNTEQEKSDDCVPGGNHVTAQESVQDNVKVWNIKGSGTIDDPYQIATADDLDFIRENMKSHYILVNDIDLSNIDNFIPIGWRADEEDDVAFFGTFNGNNHSITGLTITEYNPNKSYYGLFASGGQTSKFENLKLHVSVDLRLDKPSKYKYKNDLAKNVVDVCIGGLVGYIYSNSHETGHAINCVEVGGNISLTFSESELYSDIDEAIVSYRNHYIGGLIGYGRETSIDNSINSVNVFVHGDHDRTIHDHSRHTYVGGLAGSLYSVNNSINHGNIYSNFIDELPTIGGIVAAATSITKCINTGSLRCETAKTKSPAPWSWPVIGGIVGYIHNAENCINTGDITIIDSRHFSDDFKWGEIAAAGVIAYFSGDDSDKLVNLINVGSINIVPPQLSSPGFEEITVAGVLGGPTTYYSVNRTPYISDFYNFGDVQFPEGQKEIYFPNYYSGRVLASRGSNDFSSDTPYPDYMQNLHSLENIKRFRVNKYGQTYRCDGIDLPLYDIYARVNKILTENGMPTLEQLGYPISSFPGETKDPTKDTLRTYYEGDLDWCTFTYVSSNPEKLDEELSQLVIFNDNPELLSVTLTNWNKSENNTATTTIPITAIKGGTASFGLKLGEKIISQIDCKIIPKFSLSSPGVTLETESKAITLQANSPFITEAFAKELLDKMTWTVTGHEGVEADQIHVEKNFHNGTIQFIFTISPYLDASYETNSTVTIKGLSLRDITFNIYQKGFMSAYDLLLMEAVDQYVTPNKYIDEMNRILQDTSLPEEQRWKKYCEYLSSNGLLNSKEGVAWAKDAYEASRQLQYMTNNDLWLYSLYDDFLRNDPKGQAMIALLYANNLVIGGEYKDYIKPTTYLTEETPEVKKYKTLLYNFMSATSDKKIVNLKIDNWIKLISLSNSASSPEFVESIKDLYNTSSSEGAFEKMFIRYAQKFWDEEILPDNTGIKIVDQFHEGVKLAKDAGNIIKIALESVNYMLKISAMSQVYQDYIDFFNTIIHGDSSIVPDSLKTAAFQIQCECTDMLEGYELQLAKLATDTAWNEITDEILGEFLSDITKTLDLAAFVANSLTGYKEFSNQVAYTQGYATLTNLYISKIQSTAEAYKNNRSPELAKQFTDEYQYLKLLREKGEESYMNLCYKDSAAVKKVIGLFQSTQPWYEERLYMMMDNIAYAKNASFIFSKTAASASSNLPFEHKVIIQCPVDVEVYKGNELLFTIKDGQECDVSNEYGRFISVKRTFEDDYAKAIYLNDSDCYIKLVGQTDGLVTITHSQLKNEDVFTTVSDYNPVSVHSIMTYRLNDPDQRIEIDSDGDGNTDSTTTLYPVSQEVILPGEIRVTRDKVELEKGQSIVIGVDVLPFDTTNKDVLWESSDESVITVKNGVLHAAGPGTATILIKTPDGSVSKAINVTVIASTPQIPVEPGKPETPTDPSKPNPTPIDPVPGTPLPIDPERPAVKPSLPSQPSSESAGIQSPIPVIQLNTGQPMTVTGFITPSSIIQSRDIQKAEHVPTASQTDAGLSILAMLGAAFGFGLGRRRKKAEQR